MRFTAHSLSEEFTALSCNFHFYRATLTQTRKAPTRGRADHFAAGVTYFTVSNSGLLFLHVVCQLALRHTWFSQFHFAISRKMDIFSRGQ